MNWKSRFKNKLFLTSFTAIILTCIYSLLTIFEITPRVDYGTWENLVALLLDILVAFGVVINPTTKGVKDND